MLIDTTCPHCDAECQVELTFGEPARTYGPPELCHPGSSDEIEPSECPECGKLFDQAKIKSRAGRLADDPDDQEDLA